MNVEDFISKWCWKQSCHINNLYGLGYAHCFVADADLCKKGLRTLQMVFCALLAVGKSLSNIMRACRQKRQHRSQLFYLLKSMIYYQNFMQVSSSKRKSLTLTLGGWVSILN